MAAELARSFLWRPSETPPMLRRCLCSRRACPCFPCQAAAAMPVPARSRSGRTRPLWLPRSSKRFGSCMAGEAGGVVTNPINKAALYDAGFRHPGHTEFLADLTGATGKQVMMLAVRRLRVVLVTVHFPLRQAIATLVLGNHRGSCAHGGARHCERDFGIDASSPRRSRGLNPHAGEDGALGDEETRLIGPPIAVPADGGHRQSPALGRPTRCSRRRPGTRYDAAICMYHDQALIPLKTLDMRNGVNVTLGLPIVRTSPDHGTAFDIAGKGVADPSSLIAALRLAAELAERRDGRAH